jgi:hypothetical protein
MKYKVTAAAILFLPTLLWAQERHDRAPLITRAKSHVEVSLLTIERKHYSEEARLVASKGYEFIVIRARLKSTKGKLAFKSATLVGDDGVKHELVFKVTYKESNAAADGGITYGLIFHKPEGTKLKYLRLDLDAAKLSFDLRKCANI